MFKNFIIVGCSILLLFFVACNERSPEMEGSKHNRLGQYCESKYLKQYFEDNSASGKFYVDSIEFLYTSLNLYKLNDSSLLFTSFYRNGILLIITPDSIRVYRTKGEDPWWVVPIHYLFEDFGVDSVVRYFEKETVPFFRNSWWDNVQVVIGYYNNDKNKIVLMDYRNSAHFSGEFRFTNSAYSYDTTVKNDFISLRGARLMNYWKFNDNLILRDSTIKRSLPR